MAWDAGAMRGRTKMEYGGMGMVPGMLTGAYGSGLIFNQPRALMVNKQGYRVCDENILQNTSVGGSIINYQQDKICFKIVTDEIAKYYIKNGFDWPSEVFHCTPDPFFEEMDECMSNYPGEIFIEESPEALAEAMGINPKRLLKTIEEYNECCDQNFDDFFCKPRQHLQKLKGKKWFAVYCRLAAYGSLGGIKVNYKYEALDPNYEPIAGLYSAGVDCCEIFADIYMYYLPGNSMGFAVNSGRIAGESAAGFILGIED